MLKRTRLWIPFLPYFLFYLGAGLNLLVITVNNGAMPVVLPIAWPETFAPGAVMDKTHVAYSSAVHLAFLCDWIQVPWIGVVSPGDCLLWLGEWLEVPAISFWLGLVWAQDRR